jgi:hypothetical protein
VEKRLDDMGWGFVINKWVKWEGSNKTPLAII